MKISFIATVYNEERNIESLLDSLLKQSILPDEIIIVDGDSTDATASILSNFKLQVSNNRIKFLVKKGNRSVGRNEAIANASGDIIVCSDAGCILDKKWLENITKPFDNEKVDVVAGYYRGLSRNIFQKCLIPYVLVMPDKVNSNNFLPAARSMAFKKSVWKRIGGFPEQFYDNEDYVFAKKLKEKKMMIFFAKDAIAEWIPRENMKEAFIMFYRFARGDAQAQIYRPKVLFIFARYVTGIILLFLFFQLNSYFILSALYFILIIYFVWAVTKNYRYIKDLRAILILPVLQIISEVAVITGTISGVIKLWATQKTQ